MGETREARLLRAINEACAIIELGDDRLMAGDGPCGNQPPDLSLDDWRKLYETLDAARTLPCPTCGEYEPPCKCQMAANHAAHDGFLAESAVAAPPSRGTAEPETTNG